VLTELQPTVTIVLPVMFRMLESVGSRACDPCERSQRRFDGADDDAPQRPEHGVERFVHMFGMTEALAPVFAKVSRARATDATALRAARRCGGQADRRRRAAAARKRSHARL
jgi:hypothetical protein